MIYLNKILPLIISPLFIVILIISLGILLKSKKLSFLGIFVLIICSLPIFAKNLIQYLEKDYKPLKISSIENADAIVVLGGMVRAVKNVNYFSYEFTDSVDRILAGVDLLKKNKAPYLILTKGNLPWSYGKPEGEFLKDYAVKLGINKDKIILTKNVQNTDQEAKAIKELFNSQIKTVILVTSAFHMQRAIKVFDAVKINVLPFPVDFRGSYEKFTILDLIPSAFAFNQTSHFYREIIGRIYYDLKY